MKTKTLTLFLLMTGTAVCTQAQAPVKKVLLEEFTTALCGNCPPSSFDVHNYYENHHSGTVLMVHHAGFGTDSMTNTEAAGICSFFQPSTFGFAPAVLIDRAVYPWLDSVPYMSVDGFDSIATRVAGNPAAVSVGIQGTYNPTTRQLNVTATASFVQVVTNGAKHLSLFLVEDSIVNSGSGWDQKCYSAAFANAHYPGQYNASTDLISQYPHRNVQRKSLSGSTWGQSGIIPNSPALSTPYSINVTYTVPSNFNDARLYLVAYVANYGSDKFSREVLNAEEVKVSSSFAATGIATEYQGNQLNALYPNPASSQVTLQYTIRQSGNTRITVTDLSGRIGYVFVPGVEMKAGRYEATFNCENLSPGIYFVNISNENGTSSSKLIIE